MEVTVISQLIGEVGFPIAVSIALFIQNYKTTETFNELKTVLARNEVLLQQVINYAKGRD